MTPLATTKPAGGEPVIEVESLTVAFGGTRVVDNVSWSLHAGERLGIIGESGSGKSLTALAVIGLAPDNATITGSVRWRGEELLGRSDRSLAKRRGDDMAMIFQDPRTSLNPVMRIGRQIAEPLRLHRGLNRRQAMARAVELCERVGLPDPERIVRTYPHLLSGGQRQRVGIAMALACEPDLLIADEPTTALDVTVQANIVKLLRQLADEAGAALLFISHDLGLVAGLVDRIVVMRNGQVVEIGTTDQVVSAPAHEYTRRLLDAARVTAMEAEHRTRTVTRGSDRG